MKTDLRIVHNRLLGGWFIVRGPHQTPIGGRFETRAEAELHLKPSPTCYLSTSDGMWRVIVQGLPICADTPMRERAEACARQFNVTPTAIWNGDTGKFEAMQPEWKRHARPL